MLAPFGTLVFLVSLWLIAAVAAEILSKNGSRILAALRGEREAAVTPAMPRRSHRGAHARRQPLRARPELRAAA